MSAEICFTIVSLGIFRLFVCSFPVISYPSLSVPSLASQILTVLQHRSLKAIDASLACETNLCQHALVEYQQCYLSCSIAGHMHALVYPTCTLTPQSPWNSSDRGAHHRQFALHCAATACSGGRLAPPSRALVSLGSLTSSVTFSGSKIWIHSVLSNNGHFFRCCYIAKHCLGDSPWRSP